VVKVYLSSTYKDLVDHRKAICQTLRRNQYDVINMEDYVATDERPLTVCLADVAACELYVGIFAWRYGYIPAQENPEEKSITELEFRHAAKLGKSCLIFLLDPEASWKVSLIDKGPAFAAITSLRDELARDYTARFFSEIDELANEVHTAVNHWAIRRRQEESPHDSQRVSQGLNALGALMWAPSIQAAVARFQTEFAAACEQIDALGNDKDLHDQLHNLQLLCYNPIIAASRSPSHQLPWGQIKSHKLHLQPIIDCLQMIAERPSIAPTDTQWMQDLNEAQDKLDEAVEQGDPKLLQEAIWLMRPVVTVQPSRINTCLKLTTSRLIPRLTSLTDAMSHVRGDLNRCASAHPDLDPEKMRQFQTGVDSLNRLKDSLNALVQEHDSWQAIDDKLRMIENDLEQDMEQLVWSLRRSLQATASLTSTSTERWARTFKTQADKLFAAIKLQDHAKIMDVFLEYRSQATARFYVVDQKLKSLCDQLRNIDEPLAGVLREIDA
jgi:hypothetical protein